MSEVRGNLAAQGQGEGGVMGDMQAWQKELECERMMYELAIVQRIERGLATVEDARYVAGAFGLTTEWDRTHKKAANG